VTGRAIGKEDYSQWHTQCHENTCIPKKAGYLDRKKLALGTRLSERGGSVTCEPITMST